MFTIKIVLIICHSGTIHNELRIVLIGKTGSGKSSTGNTLLGREHFIEDDGFGSATFKTNSGKTMRDEQKILVVDTPGLLDTRPEISLNDTINEMLKSISITSPGIHSLILVIGLGRFTEENANVFKILMQLFGSELKKYLIVVFTFKDMLKNKNKTLEDRIKQSPDALKKIICSCRDYMAIDNTKFYDKNQDATLLIHKINAIVRSNGGQYYTSECYQIAEEFFRDDVMRQKSEGSLQNRIDAQRSQKSYSKPLPKLYQESYGFDGRMVSYTSYPGESSAKEACCSGYYHDQAINHHQQPSQAANDYCLNIPAGNDKAQLIAAANGLNKTGETQKRMLESNFACAFKAAQEEILTKLEIERNQAAAKNNSHERVTDNNNTQPPTMNEDAVYDDEDVRDTHRRRVLENEDNVNQGFWNKMWNKMKDRIKDIFDALKNLFHKN